jgi:hypothetical protein
MDSNMSDAMDIDESPDRMRQDLLDRLHWNIFGPLSDVSVRDGTILSPLSNHGIRFESVANPPVSRLAIHIMPCQEKHAMDEHEEEHRYQPPKPIIIQNTNGTPITLEDFVPQVHLYLNVNREDIYKCIDESYVRPSDFEESQDYTGNDGDVEYKFAEESDEPTHFWSGGNIPEGARFFFDDARFNECDANEFEAYVDIYAEGNMGVSFEQFLECRARV